MNPRGGGPSISHGPKVRVEFHVVAEINRERKSPEVHHRRDAPLAQLAEQLTLNQWVPGSSPGGCTTETPSSLATSLKAGFRFALKTHNGIFTGYVFSRFLDRRACTLALACAQRSTILLTESAQAAAAVYNGTTSNRVKFGARYYNPAHVAGAHFSLATTLPGLPASAWQRPLHPG